MVAGTLDCFAGARFLITGGTGLFGRALVRALLDHSAVESVIVFSHDEYAQHEVQSDISADRLRRTRFFLGDVRDAERLRRAMSGVDFVVHTATLKRMPALKYNPFELIKTNVVGTENVIGACIDSGVKKAIALSTDRAVHPGDLYNATKLCAEKMFIAGNHYSGNKPTRFAVVRHGSLMDRCDGLVPMFLKQRKTGVLPVPDPEMTRFWSDARQNVRLVLYALSSMAGGETFVPRMAGVRIAELAAIIGPDCAIETAAARPGVKRHEIMIQCDEDNAAIAFNTHFIVLPQENRPARIADGTWCPPDFLYSSEHSDTWIENNEIARLIAALDLPEAREWAQKNRVTPNT